MYLKLQDFWYLNNWNTRLELLVDLAIYFYCLEWEVIGE
jgi:hypothetical protein